MKASAVLLALATAGYAAVAGKAVTYSIGDEAFEGYFVSPSRTAPLVVIVHDWDGLNEYEIKRAAMLAKEGYAVFAADLFGAGKRPAEMEQRRALTGALYNDRARMRALLDGALAAAVKEGGNAANAVAIGYCFGGTAVLEWARAGTALKAFVAFHGGLSTPEGQDFAGVKSKIVVFHGTADESVPMSDFARLAEDLEKHKVVHEMLTYSGAPHAFSVFGSDRYREDADRKSWGRFLGVLREELKTDK